MKFKRAGFSHIEVLLALSIVGILCLTMLSLNNLDVRSYQLATIKMTQADTAIKAWGKIVSKSNETGLGAHGVITDADTLISSLSNYLTNNGCESIDVITTESFGDFYEAKALKLSNGLIVKFKYLPEKDALSADKSKFNFDTLNSPIALISFSSDVKSRGQSGSLVQEYVLKSNGIENLSDFYSDGWTAYIVEEVRLK